jgi:hypothetical protein
LACSLRRISRHSSIWLLAALWLRPGLSLGCPPLRGARHVDAFLLRGVRFFKADAVPIVKPLDRADRYPSPAPHKKLCAPPAASGCGPAVTWPPNSPFAAPGQFKGSPSIPPLPAYAPLHASTHHPQPFGLSAPANRSSRPSPNRIYKVSLSDFRDGFLPAAMSSMKATVESPARGAIACRSPDTEVITLPIHNHPIL